MRIALVVAFFALGCGGHETEKKAPPSAPDPAPAPAPTWSGDLEECRGFFAAAEKLVACPQVTAAHKQRFDGARKTFDQPISPEMPLEYQRDVCLSQVVDVRAFAKQDGCEIGITPALDAMIEKHRARRTAPVAGLSGDQAASLAAVAAARDRACACADDACAEKARAAGGAVDVSWVATAPPEIAANYTEILHELIECVVRPAMRTPNP